MDRHVLLVPSGETLPGGGERPDLEIDLGAILQAEARQKEVAWANPGTAPHLLAAFTEAWRRISEKVAGIEYQLVKGQQRVASRKAVVMMEILPDFLRNNKEIGNNPEVRAAVLTRDEELTRLQDRVDRMEAVLKLLKVKAHAFENAFTAVKRILQSDALMHGAPRPAPGDADDVPGMAGG